LRPLLREIAKGQARLEEALSAERRALIHANEQRLTRYSDGVFERAPAPDPSQSEEPIA